MNYWTPWGAPPQFGAPPQSNIIYVPMPPQYQPGPMPMPQPMGKVKGSKRISAKQMQKFHKAWEEIMKGPDGKKDDKKDDKKKGLKDKTFTWLEMTLLLITWSVPLSVIVLGGLKALTLILKSFVL